ncbi:MAG: hypothetical protein FVQ83_15700 [Chloroflexi bacterium]|nr:hypothetical protein [Chloroflexota bacterium]
MKTSRIVLFPLFGLLASTSACTLGGSTDSPPTAPPPVETALPPIATAPTTSTPVAPPEGNLETIYIGTPGQGSEITSPVLVEGLSGPTFEQNLVVLVTDVSGTQLGMQSTTIQAEVGMAGLFSVSLAFSVASNTPGRISVYDVSAHDGGIVHLSSVNVTLLSSGPDNITAAPPPEEVIQILLPASLQEISAGVLQVSGFSEYFFEANLGVIICGVGGSGAPHEICGTQDNVITEGFAMINSPDMGIAGPFSGELAYVVAGATRARVVIFALSPMDGRINHLSSQEITLNP